MDPTNHPFRKENDLANLHDYVPAVNLPGCNDILGCIPHPRIPVANEALGREPK